MPTTNLFNRYIVRDSPMSRATSSHLHSLSSPTPLVYLLGYSSTLSSRFGLLFEWVPPTIPITTASLPAYRLLPSHILLSCLTTASLLSAQPSSYSHAVLVLSAFFAFLFFSST